jgi:hypothetical protein
MEEFEITMETWDEARKLRGKFTFKVELIYQSKQVERYQLSGGAKTMIVEKNLLVKSSLFKNWKIKELNFIMDVVNESTIMTLHDIYKKIDEKMLGSKSIAYQRTEF